MKREPEIYGRNERNLIIAQPNFQELLSDLDTVLRKCRIPNNGLFLIRLLADDSSHPITHDEWEDYYIQSALRKKNKKDVKEQYYGKTVKEMTKAAIKLDVIAKRKGMGIPYDDIFNIVYYKLIDDIYVQYEELLQKCKSLEEEREEYRYEISPSSTFSENGVDIYEYRKESGELTKGLYISKNDLEVDEETKNKHEVFKFIHGIECEIIS